MILQENAARIEQLAHQFTDGAVVTVGDSNH